MVSPVNRGQRVVVNNNNRVINQRPVVVGNMPNGRRANVQSPSVVIPVVTPGNNNIQSAGQRVNLVAGRQIPGGRR